MANHTGSKTEEGRQRGLVRESENTAGRCQARRPGRLLEATCKRCPRGMAVTYRLRKQAVPYKTRLTGWLMSLRMRGSAQHAGPLANFEAYFTAFVNLVPTRRPQSISSRSGLRKAKPVSRGTYSCSRAP